MDPWDAALAIGPACEPLDDTATHEALLVLADFADLKSPWTSGHSRAVAALALEACGPAAEAAALVHDLGRVAVPNVIWDKPGPLTRDERDKAETPQPGDRSAPSPGAVHSDAGHCGGRGS
jgi:HD-GYP domain-containing protein (c-di-GMP phosphodiesterase class II)